MDILDASPNGAALYFRFVTDGAVPTTNSYGQAYVIARFHKKAYNAGDKEVGNHRRCDLYTLIYFLIDQRLPTISNAGHQRRARPEAIVLYYVRISRSILELVDH